MNFEWLVAMRYLRSPNRPAVLRLVTLLAVLGVCAGVTTLVIALSMNTGFRQAIRDRLLTVTAHVNLKPVSIEGIDNYRDLCAQLASTPGVQSIEPALYEEVLLSYGDHSDGVVLKGVDPDLERKASSAWQHLTAGSDNFAPDADGTPSIMVGRLLASGFGITAGDYVTVTSPEGNLTPFGMFPHSRRFRVIGVFDSGFYDYDANWAFTTLASSQSLRGLGDVASLLEVRVTNLDQANDVAAALVGRAGKGYTASTWVDENRALFHAMSLEKLVTALFVGLITFVAGLNILVVLTMTVADRARDIAVLMAMGARRRQVRDIFMLQGLAVSLAGTAAGLLLGYAVAWTANHWQLIPLNPQVYAIPYVPFHTNGFDAIWIAAAALAISALATIVPARSASRTLPVDILRFE
ncbi:MAG TPA: ABC transporter permease [Candidatus Acidoferrum sp.]|jgi:lipoprotein-releasing system permease protein|nr:ABC transporter permease [Candidatus Acidoferrum sp.]